MHYTVKVADSEGLIMYFDYEHNAEGKYRAEQWAKACIRQEGCAFIEIALFDDEGRKLKTYFKEGKAFNDYYYNKYGF